MYASACPCIVTSSFVCVIRCIWSDTDSFSKYIFRTEYSKKIDVNVCSLCRYREPRRETYSLCGLFSNAASVTNFAEFCSATRQNVCNVGRNLGALGSNASVFPITRRKQVQRAVNRSLRFEKSTSVETSVRTRVINSHACAFETSGRNHCPACSPTKGISTPDTFCNARHAGTAWKNA